MSEKVDYKKVDKDLYLPKEEPQLVEVGPINYIQVEGEGDPKSQIYQEVLELLYALSFTIKMSKMGSDKIDGYFEYVVPPLEGLWYSQIGSINLQERDSWKWISMIRQPDFVTNQVFEWALDKVKQKHSKFENVKVELVTLVEGKCVQIMHIGTYQDEIRSLQKIHTYCQEHHLRDVSGKKRKHHEIYLSDPRKVKREKLRTVLRIPVEEI